MKNILKTGLILGIIIFLFLGIDIKKPRIKFKAPKQITKNIGEEPEDSTEYTYYPIDGLPRKFDTVPGTNGRIFRSNQPTIKQLISILESYPIYGIIRMNSEEGTGVTIEAERKIAEERGVKFYWINAHMGYKEGEGYTKSIDTVQKILSGGNILIHCTAGADRTGYQVGKYIQDNLGWEKSKIWEYTIRYNAWERFICEGRRGYIKYLEGFYPYKEWLKMESSICRNKSY
jgi:hypothetical protein